MPRQPLGEVFGFSANNFTAQAEYYRQNRLCPFNNKVPSCTKDKANDPLGVCSVNHNDGVVITCPIRFRQDWRIAVDAAAFFFAPDTAWTSLVEIGITDGDGLAAGNIDVVLVSYDDNGRLTNFGALEVQAVYISGNVRRLFEQYMQNRSSELVIDWSGMPLYPPARLPLFLTETPGSATPVQREHPQRVGKETSRRSAAEFLSDVARTAASCSRRSRSCLAHL